MLLLLLRSGSTVCVPLTPHPDPGGTPDPASCQRPLHIPQGTSSQAAFITFLSLFSFFVLACLETKIPGISPHPPPRPSSSSLLLLLLPLIASPLFALICPQCFALTGRGSFTARLANKAGHRSALHESHHSVPAISKRSATLKTREFHCSFFPKCVNFFQTQLDCSLQTRGQTAQLIYQLAPSGATDLLQRPGSGPDHCQRDGLNGFRPLLMLFSNVLTFPQPPPPLIRSSHNAWK